MKRTIYAAALSLLFLMAGLSSHSQQTIVVKHRGGGGGPSLIAHTNSANTCTSSVNPCTFTITTTTGTGHGLILLYASWAGTPEALTGVADSGSQTWVAPSCAGTIGTHGTVCMAYIASTAAGITSVTVTSAAAIGVNSEVYEVAWSGLTGALDKTSLSTTSLGTPFTGPSTATTAQATEFLAAAVLNTFSSANVVTGSACGNCTAAWNVQDNHGIPGQGDSISFLWLVQANGPTTYAVTGSSSVGATNNVPELWTFK